MILSNMMSRCLRTIPSLWRVPTSKRRIVFIYGFCGLGGVETATVAKVHALRRRGVEASVIFSRFYGDGARSLAEQPGISVDADESTITKLQDRKLDAIVVIDHPDFMDLLARSRIDAPVVLETHSANLAPRIERFYQRLYDSRVRAIVVPSQHNKQLIHERLGQSSDVVVIPNGVDSDAFTPKLPVSQTAFPELCAGERLVLWVGRLEDEKNPQELIRISETLLDLIPNLRFVVVGDYPKRYDEKKSALIALMKRTTRTAFTFVRTVPHPCMPTLYRLVGASGGALFSTSRYESQPMTFLEAMASGCPVISSDVGGVCELIEDRITGRLYPLGNISAAVTAAIDVLDPRRPYSVSRMIQRARREVTWNYSLDMVAERYCSVFEQIYAHPRDPRPIPMDS